MPTSRSTNQVSAHLALLLIIQLTQVLTSSAQLIHATSVGTQNHTDSQPKPLDSTDAAFLEGFIVLLGGVLGLTVLGMLRFIFCMGVQALRECLSDNQSRNSPTLQPARIPVISITLRIVGSLIKQEDITPVLMGEDAADLLSTEELALLRSSSNLEDRRLKDRYIRLLAAMEKPRCVITQEDMKADPETLEPPFILAFQRTGTAETIAIAQNLSTMVEGINAMHGQLYRLAGDPAMPKATLENTQFFGINFVSNKGFFSCSLLETVKGECRSAIARLQKETLNRASLPSFFAPKKDEPKDHYALEIQDDHSTSMQSL